MSGALRLALGLHLLVIALPGVAGAMGEDVELSLVPPEPVRLVREMQSMQDRMAVSGMGTAAELRQVNNDLSKKLLELDVAAWKEPRNVHAVLVYTMSGGNPAVLKKLVQEKLHADVPMELVEGIVAFAEGKQGAATDKLEPINPRALPSAIAANVALVKGSLLQSTKPDVALDMFDYARLESPGTLVEEAALRRQILLLAAQGKHQRFATLAHQYMRRFPISAFARKFRRQLAAAVAGKAEGNDLGWLPRLGGLIAAFKPDVQREMFLEIARNAIANGKVELARYAAVNAAALASDVAEDRERSKVYEGSALILTDDFDSGVQTLLDVSKTEVPKADGDLLDAAFSVARAVRKWPDGVPKDQPAPDALPAAAGRAKQRLEHVDQLLEENSK